MNRRNVTDSFHVQNPSFSRFLRRALCVLALSSVPGCGQGLQLGTEPDDPEPEGPAVVYETCDAADDGTYLLGYRKAVAGDESALLASMNAIQQAGGTIRSSYFPQIPMVAATLPPSAVAKLRDDPGILSISRNCRHRLQSGSLARVPWGLDRIDQRSPTLDYVYQMPGTGNGVDVYVVDSGIYTEHPQFGGRASKLYKAAGIMDTRGADDCSGHGTIVAGIIGGLDYGVAKEARLLSVRVADCDGLTNDMWITEGIQQAIIHHQANLLRPGVINLSLAQEKLSLAASNAVKAAVGAGLLVVGAAGNFGKNACDHFPAAAPDAMGLPKRDPNVLVAGVVNEQDQALRSAVVNNELLQFDYGDCIDLYAPGINIRSAGAPGPNTAPRGETVSSGTSLAAAHVTGVVALYLERFPRSTPNQIKQAVRQQATGGVVTGAPAPGALLVFNGNSSSFPPRAIQLAMPVAYQAVQSRGEVWHETSFVVNPIPSGAAAILSGDLTGSVGTAVDDIFRLECRNLTEMGQPIGEPRSAQIDYHSGSCGYVRTLPPRDLGSVLARSQQQRCSLKLYDSCGVVRGGTRLFLNIR